MNSKNVRAGDAHIFLNTWQQYCTTTYELRLMYCVSGRLHVWIKRLKASSPYTQYFKLFKLASFTHVTPNHYSVHTVPQPTTSIFSVTVIHSPTSQYTPCCLSPSLIATVRIHSGQNRTNGSSCSRGEHPSNRRHTPACARSRPGTTSTTPCNRGRDERKGRTRLRAARPA